MKKLLHSFKSLRAFKIPVIGMLLVFAGVNLHAQNVCVATNDIGPSPTQSICLGSPANTLTATITTSGSGSDGNITYNWYSNTTNSTSGGTLVQTLSTTTATVTNTFTPTTSAAGSLWYYSTVTNVGGNCAGTSFTSTTVQVDVNPLPTIFDVGGGGARCSNGSLIGVYLRGSQTGIGYQLYNGIYAIEGPSPGTGNPMTFLVSSAGTYTLKAIDLTTNCITDMNGSAVVTINPSPAISATSTDVSCAGGDGSITVTGSGGTPGYLYSINGGAFSGSNIFSGLSSGNYSVVVQDANTCSVTTNVPIQSATPLSVGITSIDPGNCSGTDGSITANRIGGVDDGITPVQFKLDGDATRPYQTSNVFGGLSKGNYTITIKDSKGCTAISSTVSLTQTAGTAPTIFDVTGGGARCSNDPGVSIRLSGSQVGVNYQLSRSGSPVGTVLSGTGNPLSFLLNTAGVYTIIATNTTAGCNSIMNGDATIIVNLAPDIFDVSGGGTRCSNDLGIAIYLSGSETGVGYQLLRDGLAVDVPSPGTGNPKTFLVTGAGTYTLAAINTTSNCTTPMNGSADVFVNPAPMLFSVTGGGVSCSGNSATAIGLTGSETGVDYQLLLNGSPVGSPVAGTGSPLSFQASNGGSYSIMALNATTNCSSIMTDSTSVSINPALTPSYTKYYASSCVGNDGTITVTGNGGTPGYLYSIDNGPFTSNNYFGGLAAGEHRVEVKDANGCLFVYDSITVLTAPAIQVTATTISAGACTGNDGSVIAHYFGGVVDAITPLEFKLDGDATRPFQVSNVFNGLAPGNYTVTQKDSKGCTGVSPVVTITQAAPLTLVSSGSYQTNVSSCGNGSDGNIVITVTGGVLPFQRTINGVSYPTDVRTFGFGNLAVGTYNVTVTDFSGCSISLSYNITQASAPIVKVANYENETCAGANDGYISLSPSGIGGIPEAYKYSKDGGNTFQTSYFFPNLAPGNYNMVVQDSKGCLSAPLTITIAAGTITCGPVPGKGPGLLTSSKNRTLNTGNADLKIQAYPNPSNQVFTLNLQSSGNEKVTLIVTDMLGKVMYKNSGSGNHQYQFGRNFTSGMYIVQVIQGKNIQTLKLIKSK